MRINKWVAQAIGVSRRQADTMISAGRVTLNNQTASLGSEVNDLDKVAIDGREILGPVEHFTILLNKPVGYVCSRDGQGSKTIYDLLPPNLKHLKAVGRLDKDSSGLLVMTTDGQLAHELTHPKFEKIKIYIVNIDKPLTKSGHLMITTSGVDLIDGPSRLELKSRSKNQTELEVKMHEGRNRQIRRTFEKLGYRVISLHRTNFGTFGLQHLKEGQYLQIK